MSRSRKLHFVFSDKHKQYIRDCLHSTCCVAEGAVRAGKTIDNVFAFCTDLETTEDKIHLATGSTIAAAKLNIGDCNGFGIEYQYRGRSRWGKYKGNEALYVRTKTGQKVIIFAGGAKSDSFKKIRGNSYGMWIATEINLHHDSTIKEAFNRQLAAKERKIFWDLNPGAPQHQIYTEYIDRFPEQFGNRYCYQHFTIHDNATISEERRKEIERQYNPASVWYRRDILGERCAAEGLVYQTYADNPEAFLVDEEPGIIYAEMGIDFGGGSSGHAFVLVGYTARFQDKIILEEWYSKNALNPAQLERAFADFTKKCRRKYQFSEVLCDSAEQTLINGLRRIAVEERLGVNISNALKRPIIDRIRCDERLFAQGRLKIMRHCKVAQAAFASSVWDGKHITEDVRLDNGSTNIDILDAQEYATERHIQELMDYREAGNITFTVRELMGIT